MDGSKSGRVTGETPLLENERSSVPPLRSSGTALSCASTQFSRVLWEEAQEYCKSTLGRQDYLALEKFENCEDLLQSLTNMHLDYQSSWMQIFLTRLEPCLGHLRSFLTLIALTVGGEVMKTAIIWGLLNLVIEVRIMSCSFVSSSNSECFASSTPPAPLKSPGMFCPGLMR
jgi:hypothetical protein